MLSSYQGLNPSAHDWLWFQSPEHFGVWNMIQMLARSPQPDMLLLYQFNVPKSTPPKQPWWSTLRRSKATSTPPADMQTLLRGVPKERTIYLLREPPLDEVINKHKAHYRAAQQYCGYVSGPDDFAPNPNYMPAIWYVNRSFQELNAAPVPDKIRPCSWITSGIDRTENHRKRLDFLRLLRSNELEFDLYGRNLPDWSHPRGELRNKWHGMAPYYYNLAIENYADNDWYVSEKLWDALLGWCLPIYFGGAAADRLIPPESFVRLPSLDEKGLAYIREVTATPDLWYDRKEAIAEARQIILHKLNLLNWLSEFADTLE
ncbi:MAG TPA: glycosyltransferase family 10 domain-containing protein [Elainellaceae cyanobacterium]